LAVLKEIYARLHLPRRLDVTALQRGYFYRGRALADSNV